MKRTRIAAGIAAAAMLAAQPALAAEEFRDRTAPAGRTGAFAGLSVTVTLDRGARRRPEARLQLTTTYSVREADGAMATRRAAGVRFGAERGRLAVTIAGRDPAQVRDQLGVGGSTGTVLLIGAGIVLAVVVLASVASAMPTPGPRDGAFD